MVRYNVRGTGRSTGSKAWSADVDAADANALCKVLLERAAERSRMHDQKAAFTVDRTHCQPRLLLLAYSYGSCIAAQVAAATPSLVAAYVSIGFPLGEHICLALHVVMDMQ